MVAFEPLPVEPPAVRLVLSCSGALSLGSGS